MQDLWHLEPHNACVFTVLCSNEISLHIGCSKRNEAAFEVKFPLRPILYCAQLHLLCRVAQDSHPREKLWRSFFSHPVFFFPFFFFSEAVLGIRQHNSRRHSRAKIAQVHKTKPLSYIKAHSGFAYKSQVYSIPSHLHSRKQY